MSVPEKRFLVSFSFPGETRALIEPVADLLAERLTKSRILYDKYHVAEFARPNLDVYLQRLYHDDSALIVVLLCDAFERKEWCNIEWRAVRDLINKRHDAIMFLRIGDAPVSGIFPFDGYVEISKRPAHEVASLILDWLGQDQRLPPDPTTAPIPICRTSRRAALLVGEQRLTYLWPPVTEMSWDAGDVRIVVTPDDPSDAPVLGSLRNNDRIIFSHQHRAAIATVRNVAYEHHDMHDRWTIVLTNAHEEFVQFWQDLGYNDRTPTDLAVMRARRLLLGEHPTQENLSQSDAFLEAMIQGVASPLSVKGSIFPELYRVFRDQPQAFLEAAWSTSVVYLHLAQIVTSIRSFELTLTGNGRLQVALAADRLNETITINGTCPLA